MLIQIKAKNTFQIAIFSVNVLFLDESTMHCVKQIHIKCEKNKNIDGLLKLISILSTILAGEISEKKIKLRQFIM